MSRQKTVKKIRKKRPIRKLKQKGKSLLILECNADKLASQSMSMAEEIKIISQLFAPKVKIEVVKTTTEEMLKSQFASLVENQYQFETIVVIGHSSSTSINLTYDRSVSWAGFAKWIEIFKPKQMVLIACQSGNIFPVQDLFA